MNREDLIAFYEGLLEDWGRSNRNVKNNDGAVLWQFNKHALTVGTVKQTLKELKS